eukprot:scaffold53559_cov66-Phaeocystis_antarctica.AAC.9
MQSATRREQVLGARELEVLLPARRVEVRREERVIGPLVAAEVERRGGRGRRWYDPLPIGGAVAARLLLLLVPRGEGRRERVVVGDRNTRGRERVRDGLIEHCERVLLPHRAISVHVDTDQLRDRRQQIVHRNRSASPKLRVAISVAMYQPLKGDAVYCIPPRLSSMLETAGIAYHLRWRLSRPLTRGCVMSTRRTQSGGSSKSCGGSSGLACSTSGSTSNCEIGVGGFHPKTSLSIVVNSTSAGSPRMPPHGIRWPAKRTSWLFHTRGPTAVGVPLLFAPVGTEPGKTEMTASTVAPADAWRRCEQIASNIWSFVATWRQSLRLSSMCTWSGLAVGLWGLGFAG